MGMAIIPKGKPKNPHFIVTQPSAPSPDLLLLGGMISVRFI